MENLQFSLWCHCNNYNVKTGVGPGFALGYLSVLWLMGEADDNDENEDGRVPRSGSLEDSCVATRGQSSAGSVVASRGA